MSKGGRFEKKAPRKGRKIALILACVLVAVMMLGLVACSRANDALETVNQVEVEKVDYTQATEAAAVQAAETTAETAAQTEATEAAKEEVVSKREDFQNFLVVCRPAWETNEGGWTTDTMILCTLNTRTKTLTMTSLMPEAYVEAPAYKNQAAQQVKLNTVYGLGSTYGNGKAGSMEYMNLTLYHNFGIEIDQNFEIDFQLFARIVRRLESVTIDLSAEEAKYLSEKTNSDIQPGQQTMGGDLAQAYVKMWSDEESGVTSLSAQRKLTEAIVNKVRTSYVANLENIVKETLPSITTSMNYQEMREFVISLLPMLRNLSIEKGGTCPAVYENETITNDKGEELNVVTFDVAETTKTIRALTLGEK